MSQGIVVDAETGRVELVEISDHTDIYKHLKCDTFELPFVDEVTGDGLYCDEEAYVKGEPPQFFVYIPSMYPNPIAGNILLLGCDMRTGESKDVTLTVPQVQAMVMTMTRQQVIGLSRSRFN